MFQMSTQLFENCWPAIAAQFEEQKSAMDAQDALERALATGNLAEADYVLGVAIGYAMRMDDATGASVGASFPGGRTNARGTPDRH